MVESTHKNFKQKIQNMKAHIKNKRNEAKLEKKRKIHTFKEKN